MSGRREQTLRADAEAWTSPGSFRAYQFTIG
jgi:hypothetical protein